MLACRPRPHRLATLAFHNIPGPARSTSTSSTQAAASAPQPADKPHDSIFTAPESPWDHVFSDIDPIPPPPSAQRLHTRPGDNDSTTTNAGIASFSGRKKGHGPNQNQHLMQRASGVRHQRASITAREMSVFDEMFDLIFNAVSGKDGKASPSALGSASALGSSSFGRTPPSAAAHVPSSSLSGQTPSIGRAGAPLNDLFRTLRRHTSRVRWTTAIDEELDRKKETMELFNTDHELLQWVTIELFGESQQWDEEAKKAIAASSAGGTNEERVGNGLLKAGSSVEASATSSSSTSSGPPINHSIYPHLIAHAMRIFRTTYSNPSLSLAIFNHAARVSIPSYVFGCTAPAYNELIEAKWEGWGDLEGVCNALEEMRANGVKIDGRTRIVVEKVRREVGEARPAELGEDGQGHVEVNPLARRVWGELGEVEVMKLLHRIEQLALRDRSRKSTASPHEESWKSAVLRPVGDDGWSFDGWDKKQKQKRTRKTRDNRTVLDTPGEGMAFR